MSAQLNQHPFTSLVLALSSRLSDGARLEDLFETLAHDLATAASAQRIHVRLEVPEGELESVHEARGGHSSLTRFRLPIRARGASYGWLAIEFSRRIERPGEVMLATETLLQLLARAAEQARLQAERAGRGRELEDLNASLLSTKVTARAAGVLATSFRIAYAKASALLRAEADRQGLPELTLAQRIVAHGPAALRGPGFNAPGLPLRKIA